MSDILIRGMEMPKHCGKCGIEWCNRWKKLIVAGMPCAKSRPADCPLIPVPDHGDLIDRDELIDIAHELIRTAKNDDLAIGVKWLLDYIIDAPTVIPEDGQDTNVPIREDG